MLQPTGKQVVNKDERSGSESPNSPSRGVVQRLAGRGYEAQMEALKPAAQDALGHGLKGASASSGDIANQGVSGPGGTLPHAQQIQQSFGRFDVSAIQSHTDSAAVEASAQLGARGFAFGDQVALKDKDLRTAAHEAAHVIQQRGGLSLEQGMGEVGDRHEQHADAVADLVVAGKSAEGLLSQYGEATDSKAGGAAVQRTVDHAIILAAHDDGIAVGGWPQRLENFIDTLKSLADDGETAKFKALKTALVRDMGSDDRDTVEMALTGVDSTVLDLDFVADDDVDGYAEVQAANGVICSLLPTLLKPLDAVLSAMDGDDPMRAGLQRAYDYLSIEGTNLGQGQGRLRCTPAEHGAADDELAGTNTGNGMITFYKPFFNASRLSMEDTILHESIHAVLGTDDKAYKWQRIFRHLPLELARNNPDSYVASFRHADAGSLDVVGASATTSDVEGVDPAELDNWLGIAEAVALFGRRAAVEASAQLATPDGALGQYATAFANHYAQQNPGRQTLADWAAVLAQACVNVGAFFRLPMRVTATTTEAGATAFVLGGADVAVTLRTDFENKPLWLCAKAFKERTGANVSLAKALFAMYDGPLI